MAGHSLAALVNDILLPARCSPDVTQIMQFFRHNFNSFSVLVINHMRFFSVPGCLYMANCPVVAVIELYRRIIWPTSCNCR